MGRVRSTSSPGRADILEAALLEFSERGFAGATTVAIARRAGVAQPLVHHHFGSKQNLWSEVCAVLFDDLHRSLEQAISEVEGAARRERIAHLLRSFVLFISRRPELSRLIRVESAVDGPAFEQLHERWLVPTVDLFVRELRAAMDDGVLDEVDPALAYALVVGAGTYPFADATRMQRTFGVDMSEPANADRYAELVVRVLVRGLAAETPSSPTPSRRGRAQPSRR